jgi:hypothetical protein
MNQISSIRKSFLLFQIEFDEFFKVVLVVVVVVDVAIAEDDAREDVEVDDNVEVLFADLISVVNGDNIDVVFIELVVDKLVKFDNISKAC